MLHDNDFAQLRCLPHVVGRCCPQAHVPEGLEALEDVVATQGESSLEGYERTSGPSATRPLPLELAALRQYDFGSFRLFQNSARGLAHLLDWMRALAVVGIRCQLTDGLA